MSAFAVTAAATGAAAYLLLALAVAALYRRSPLGPAVLLASALTCAWMSAQVFYYLEYALSGGILVLQVLELARNASWIYVLARVLARSADRQYAASVRALYWAFAAAAAVPVGSWLAAYFGFAAESLGIDLGKITLLGFLAQAVFGLALVEQVYRNTYPEARWAIKHLCFAVGGMLAYDFYLYAEAVLFNRLTPDVWSARPAVDALAVPFVLLSAARNNALRPNLFVSRKVVFHVTAVFAAGAYLLLMSAAGYYVKAYGGSWGGALRIVFLCLALAVLVALIASTQLRSRLRAFVARHFYRNKYDYQEAWLSFTDRLAQIGDDPHDLRQTILKAIADVMDSTGGVMWHKGPNGSFAVVARWVSEMPAPVVLDEDHPLVKRLQREDATIDLETEAASSTVDANASVPVWLLDMPRAWIVVPIVHREELLAFIVLESSRTDSDLTGEDRELLRTLGHQAAGYLALLRATEALSDARQFDAFNRLSAFLVHDLKNVVAQLSLIVHNAEKHRTNPEFITDAFNTVSDAVTKMNRMMANLRQSHADDGATDVVDLVAAARKAVASAAARRPVPSLSWNGEPLAVLGHRDRLVDVFEHLLQNAQDATPETGRIAMSLRRVDDKAVIEVADTGCGMSEDFMQNHLFKPFDTTKGKAGMGIGVYESLHVVSSIGGKLAVRSREGEGTQFSIVLPLHETAGESVGGASPAAATEGARHAPEKV
ncbi:MAG TPA: PEP-CTERM system histidine kinase PrsK [Gammaproteobacteria bacterium]|nr:PEP-CTERM system histidine kinase PrsK [Gammaproteobacteria bacterium]